MKLVVCDITRTTVSRGLYRWTNKFRQKTHWLPVCFRIIHTYRSRRNARGCPDECDKVGTFHHLWGKTWSVEQTERPMVYRSVYRSNVLVTTWQDKSYHRKFWFIFTVKNDNQEIIRESIVNNLTIAKCWLGYYRSLLYNRDQDQFFSSTFDIVLKLL